MGDLSMDDILDTCDLIFSNDNRLLPSIERDESGNITDLNEKANANWKKFDINNIIRDHPDAFKKVHLLLNCEKNDEFGIANGTKKIHETLIELEINHHFELYSDPKAALTPHVLGIGYHELPAIRFCLQYIS